MKFLSVFQKKISGFLPFIFVFIASLYRPYDADLGWHLKYGEYFFRHGRILKENIFSTEMTDFIWPNTSWGIDLIYYSAYYLLGFFGLTFLAALVITLTFYFFAKAFDLDYWQKVVIFPLLIILENPVNEVSFRGQTVSVMMLGLLILILSKYEKFKSEKILLWLIPLFLFWANIHGQFILGFGIMVLWFFLYFLGQFLEDRFEIKKLFSSINNFVKNRFRQTGFILFILLTSFFATLIHPFGFGIYTDAFLHFRNQDLQYIIEYLPFDDLSEPWWNQMFFGIIVFLGAVFLFFSGAIKKYLPWTGILGVLFTLSWWVRRYAWSMYYLGIPLLKPLADFVKPDSEKTARKIALVLFVLYIAITGYIKLPFKQYTDMNWQVYCEQYGNCTFQSLEYVRDNKLTDKLLTLYGWGGFIIWNFPEVKPSIDGRMHLWKDSNGYSAFSEYYALEQDWEDIDKSKYDNVLMWKDKNIYGRLEELVRAGKWKKPYEDQYAGVFTRVKDSSVSSEFILNP